MFGEIVGDSHPQKLRALIDVSSLFKTLLYKEVGGVQWFNLNKSFSWDKFASCFLKIWKSWKWGKTNLRKYRKMTHE